MTNTSLSYSEERIKNDLTRNALTDEWKDRGAKEGAEFALLTNTLHEGTFEISIQHHKKHKLLPTRANLRDHMTHLELALTSLSEATAITLHQKRFPCNILAVFSNMGYTMDNFVRP
jgi:DNA-damage-inducible protein D